MKRVAGLIVLLIAAAGIISMPVYAKEEVKRTVSKSFAVSSGDKLDINTQYGNVKVVEWNKPEVSFSVEIIGQANNIKDAEKQLERVTLNIDKKGNKVSAHTKIASQSNCNNCGVAINYVINAPSSLYMNFLLKYCNLSVDKTVFDFKADIQYGNLRASTLSGKNNSINIKYGNVDIINVTDLLMEIDYGNNNISKVENLNLTSSYTNDKIGEAGYISATFKYGDVKIQAINKLEATAGYTDITISELFKNLDMPEVKYGSLKIEKVSADFDFIRAGASYSDVNISVGKGNSFTTRLETSYGKIFTNGLSFSNKDSNKENTFFVGTAGNSSNPKSRIEIHNRYGNISIKE